VEAMPKKKPRRKMVLPLPRLVYEEPVITFTRTRASRVKTIRMIDKDSGEVANIFCEICKHPIAMRDSRVRVRKEDSDRVLWRHSACKR